MVSSLIELNGSNCVRQVVVREWGGFSPGVTYRLMGGLEAMLCGGGYRPDDMICDMRYAICAHPYRHYVLYEI